MRKILNTYSLTYIPLEYCKCEEDMPSSHTDVPKKFFVKNPKQYTFEYIQSHTWRLVSKECGWRIPKDQFDEHVTVFYTDNVMVSNYRSNKIVFLDVKWPDYDNCAWFNIYKSWAAMPDWSIGVVISNDRIINADDNYVYIAIPHASSYEQKFCLFINEDEYNRASNSKKEKEKKRVQKLKKDFDEIDNANINISTSKFIVTKINKSFHTKFLPNIKIGDTIYASRPLLDDKGLQVNHKYGTAGNKIDVYINDRFSCNMNINKFIELISFYLQLERT